MSKPEHFRGFQFRPVKPTGGGHYRPLGLALGSGPFPLEVVVATADAEPRLTDVRAVWRERSNRRAAQLMLVELCDGKAAVCGLAGEDPPAYPNVDIGQAERICREAFGQPDRHASTQAYIDYMRSRCVSASRADERRPPR